MRAKLPLLPYLELFLSYMMKSLALLGLPGCGKSYWGKKIATHYKVSFIDLDSLIEKEAGMTINEIFHEGGEHLFRSMESSCLFALSQNKLDEKLIIALGGGTPAFSNNMSIINSFCTSIYLNISVDTVMKNLLSDTENHRPLVKKTNEAELSIYLEKLLLKREPAYLLADYLLLENEVSIENFEKVLKHAK